MREAIGVEIEASEVEVDGVRKAFLRVAEAIGWRALIVLIRLLMPSAGPLVAPEITALTMPQRCIADHALRL